MASHMELLSRQSRVNRERSGLEIQRTIAMALDGTWGPLGNREEKETQH